MSQQIGWVRGKGWWPVACGSQPIQLEGFQNEYEALPKPWESVLL